MQQFCAARNCVQQASNHIAGLGVYVNLIVVCFLFDMGALMPDSFVTSYGACQSVCFKHLLISLKYQPCVCF